MRHTRKARIRKQGKAVRLKRKVTVLVTVSLFTSVAGSIVVNASTLDDLRDLYGKTRIDRKYTDDEKREIYLEWSKVNQRNNAAKLFRTEDKETAIKVTEETTALVESLTQAEEKFRNTFLGGGSVTSVLQYKTELENLSFSLSMIKQIGDVIHIDIIPNDWEVKLKDLEETLTEIDSYTDLGDVASDLLSPVRDHFYLSSLYGLRFHPIESTWKSHGGIDLIAPVGTDILSTWNGKVTGAYVTEKGGNTVEITHDDGLVTRYLHLNEILVKEGQKVNQYDVIGTLGGTGAVTGPHLHFEVYLDGESVNPIYFFGKTGENAVKTYLSNNPSERTEEVESLLKSIKDKPTWVTETLNDGVLPEDVTFRKFGEKDATADEITLDKGYTSPKPSALLVDHANPKADFIPEELKQRVEEVEEVTEGTESDSFTNPNLPNSSSMKELLGLIEENK